MTVRHPQRRGAAPLRISDETISGSWTFSGDVKLADDVSLLFGTDSDIDIQWDSANSQLLLDGGTVVAAKFTSTGDTVLTLEADSDNSGEGDNVWIKFDQDGGAVGSIIGHAGSGAVKPDGSTFTGGEGNDLVIATDGDGANISLGGSDGAVLRVLNATAGNAIRVYEDAHSDYIYMKHTGIRGEIGTHSASEALEFTNSIHLDDNIEVRFGNSADAWLTYDGNSLDLQFASSDDQFNIRDGGQIRMWQPDDSTFSQLSQNADDFVINTQGDHGFHVLYASQSGIYYTQVGMADDVTTTIDMPNDAGFVFIVASTTSAGETGQHGAFFYFSGTTMIEMTTHTNWSFGSGSNPDVDTEHNVWRSATDQLSIKNRRGSFRYYGIYVFGGL